MIRIIVDSSTLYTVEEGRQLNIDVVPLTVTINQKSYKEFEELSATEFYEMIQQGHIPTSSQPAVGEYIDLFEKYKDDDVLVIAMADGLSGTYQSCVGAKETSGYDNVVVINSKTLCVPHRLVVNDAIEMRDQGKSFQEIVDMVTSKCNTAISFLLPQDFNFLKRGGRLTPFAATLGGFLRIQPILTQTEDGTRLEKFGIGRNFNIAVNRVLDHLQEIGIDNQYRFGVSHAFTLEQANQIVEKIKKKFNVTKVELEELSCAFITQGGPLCVAIQVIKA